MPREIRRSAANQRGMNQLIDIELDDEQRPSSRARQEEIDDEVEVIHSAHIPDGEYDLKYCWHETLESHGGGKLKIIFEIADGEHTGTQLEAYYPVTLKSRPSKFGKFAVSDRQKYYEEMVRLFPDISRRDRVSPRRLVEKLIVGRVEIVTSTWDGSRRSDSTQYSKVAELIRLKGDEAIEWQPEESPDDWNPLLA